MTSFVAWVAVDNRAPASIYFASDSRLSDTNNTWRWDFGRKLFASRTYPDIFGYIGDVLFPSQILGQIVDLVDTGVIFTSRDTIEDKLDKLKTFLYQVDGNYPRLNDVSIIYCSRYDYDGKSSLHSTFRVYRLRWEKKQWKSERIGLPMKSGVIIVDGSGKKGIEDAMNIWQQSTHKETSRSVFSAFCDALEKTEDPCSGGAPQLVGIHRKGNAKYFGILYRRKRYFLSLPVANPELPNNIGWFNDIFEITDGETKKRKAGAKKHLDITSK